MGKDERIVNIHPLLFNGAKGFQSSENILLIWLECAFQEMLSTTIKTEALLYISSTDIHNHLVSLVDDLDFRSISKNVDLTTVGLHWLAINHLGIPLNSYFIVIISCFLSCSLNIWMKRSTIFALCP